MNGFIGIVRRGARSASVRVATLPALLALIASACTFDPDDRCGQHQIYNNHDRCVCEEGAALTATGCVPCGEHELPGADRCVCVVGYSRPAEGAACEPTPEALGAACSADAPCADPTYDHCQPAANQTGYCTNRGCTSSSECSAGYACDLSTSPSVCKQPPLGQGKLCMTASDCADGEATYCEAIRTHQCLVQNCSLSPNNCFEGWTCTDLSMYGLPNLCIAGGAP